jgi:hypothetical protein
LATATQFLIDFSGEVPPCVLCPDGLGVVVGGGVLLMWLQSDFVGFPIASNTIYVLKNKRLIVDHLLVGLDPSTNQYWLGGGGY